jgi:hypothetical protein
MVKMKCKKIKEITMNKESVDLRHQNSQKGMTQWPRKIIGNLNLKQPFNPDGGANACSKVTGTDYSEEEMRGRYRD